MKFGATGIFAIALSLLITCHPAIARERITDTTVDGLELIKNTKLALVYAEPGADLARYNRIRLTDPYVAFKKNWQRNQNRNASYKVSTDDMSRIKAELAGLFNDVFIRKLEEHGYVLTSEIAEDVLLLKPAIINLDIVAPDTRAPGVVHSYSETAGEMTLYLELYDSVTDDLIAKALDRKIDRYTGYFQWRNRVSNRAAARRILQEWAEVFTQGLDAAQGKDTDSGATP